MSKIDAEKGGGSAFGSPSPIPKIDYKRALKALVLCSISVAAFPVIYYMLGKRKVEEEEDETDEKI